MIPDVAKCFLLMEEHAMLPNIRRHSIIVARAALQIIDGLSAGRARQADFPARDLVIAGALLHDIAKTPCLKNHCDHARAGAEICMELGYPEVAPIVAEHVVLRDHNPARYQQGIFSATEIIYYADKRVRHEEIVSLEQRLEYILDHYGMQDPEMHRRIRYNFEKCVELERYLFTFVHFSPDQLADKVSAVGGTGPLGSIPGDDGMHA